MAIDPNAILGGMANMSYNIASKLPARQKSFDTSRYLNLGAPMVNTTPQFAPTNFKNLGSITTPYGGSTKWEKFHPGVDIANKIGTPVPAYAGGTVIEASTGHKQGEKGYGNYVIIQDAQGNKWRYSHLNNVWMPAGTQVAKGTVIGAMGNTGSTYSTSGGTGSHLDLRIRDAYNKYVNPYNLVTG